MKGFLADENLPLPVVISLRLKGMNLTTVREACLEGKPDNEVLEYALKHDLAIITMDRRDFKRLHHSGFAHKGILGVRFYPDFPEMAEAIFQAVRDQDNLDGTYIPVNRTNP